MTIFLDSFAFRHFDDPNYAGAKIISHSKESFIELVRSIIEEKGGFNKISVEGYAPFCRHIFIENPTNTVVDSIEITDDIESLIQTKYHSRTKHELPVLIRFIKGENIEIPKAKYLDLIFYSYEQLVEEAKSMNLGEVPKFDWGLISIKGQNHPKEIPMQPITMMRNALGKEYGGSSVQIDPIKYQESVEYWSKHISIV
jgi:hypothetical protein